MPSVTPWGLRHMLQGAQLRHRHLRIVGTPLGTLPFSSTRRLPCHQRLLLAPSVGPMQWESTPRGGVSLMQVALLHGPHPHLRVQVLLLLLVPVMLLLPALPPLPSQPVTPMFVPLSTS